jgi:hypothetical protein
MSSYPFMGWMAVCRLSCILEGGMGFPPSILRRLSVLGICFDLLLKAVEAECCSSEYIDYGDEDMSMLVVSLAANAIEYDSHCLTDLSEAAKSSLPLSSLADALERIRSEECLAI